MGLGLDYIAIGQRLNTFSGGERQRLKLTKQINETDNIFVLMNRVQVYTLLILKN